MGKKKNNVISLARAKAIRDTLRALHSPDMQAIVYAGASGEFKRLVAPTIRSVLSSKGASEKFQKEMLRLLERVYATQHVERRDIQTDKKGYL